MNKSYTFFLILFLMAAGLNAETGPVLILSQTVQGIPLVGSLIPARQGAAMDANGDGVSDIVTFRRTAGQSFSLFAKSGRSEEVWEYPIPNSLTWPKIELFKFLGFYELNNESSNKEALFGRPQDKQYTDIIILDYLTGLNKQFSPEYVLLAILNLNVSDNDFVVQLYNKQNSTIEYWGQGPALESFPTSFSLEKIIIDAVNARISYLTQVNGQQRRLNYNFKPDKTVDVDVQDGSGKVLLNFQNASRVTIPDNADEAAAWLIDFNPILTNSIGIATIWQNFNNGFSTQARSGVGSAFGGIFGGIGDILDVIEDLLCNTSSDASCDDGSGHTVSVHCDCGIAICVTQTIVVEVPYIAVNPETGDQEIRVEYKTEVTCVCHCEKFRKLNKK